MTSLLIKYAAGKAMPEQRRGALTALSGIVCIICNLLLCTAKFIVGTLAGSVSVTADAVNNLSDCATNIVTLLSAKLSDKPDDKEHPFGHGRVEYVSALIIAVSIFVVSFELAKTSVEKILHPAEIKFSLVYMLVLGGTILVKLWMAYFNYRLYKQTDNINLKGVMQDSLNDCVATSATMFSMVLAHAVGFTRADGIFGLAVSVFIFWSGIGVLKGGISPLIGEPPSKEITDKIEEIICKSDIVLGVHDLIIHNYGANKIIASADAEVDAASDIFTIHNAIDDAEREILSELGVIICIHIDPVDVFDGETEKYRKAVLDVINEYNSAFSFHDLRIDNVDGKKRLSFDLSVPFDNDDMRRIEADITAMLKIKHPEVIPEINVEHSYI